MNASRSILADMLAEGSIERVPVDSVVAGNLLRQADNHLRTAEAGASGGDNEGAFQLAYDACRKTCLALVLATGLRPKGDAPHVATFKAAAAIADSFGGRPLIIDAGNLRYVRHGVEYRAEAVGDADVQDAIALGGELVEQLRPRVEQILEASG